MERFSRTCREEVLDCYDYDMLDEVRRMTADWLVCHGEHQPHDSHGHWSRRQCLMARCAEPSAQD
jgi:putative transposase